MNYKRILITSFIALSLILAGCTSQQVPQQQKEENTKDEHVQKDDEQKNSSTVKQEKTAKKMTGKEEELTAARIVYDSIEKIVEYMPLEQKVGQRFLAWIPGNEVDEQTEKLITEGMVSGFIIYKWRNFDKPQDFKTLVEQAQQVASKNNPPQELFIAVDQEGGRVAAFRYPEMFQMPAAFHWGKYKDPQIAWSVGYIIGKELMHLGCNMNLAPVLDLYDKPDDTIIGDRAMGSDPHLVAKLGKFYIEGAREAGIISVAKHFPGHGVTTVDSHGYLPVVDTTVSEMIKRDLVPFKEAVDCGVEAVMTAHILYPEIDDTYPATLSPLFVRRILREEMGFEGIVMTDAFSMGAITKEFDVETALLQCFKAGIDLILVDQQFDVMELRDMTVQMVREGRISEEEIDRGLYRILKLKESRRMITFQR